MSADTGNWVGQVLSSGRYQVMALLGAGGMAFVYKALDLANGQVVVVKVPRQAMLEDPEFTGRFTREVKSLVRLDHPHIVKVLDVGEHEKRPYLILEYLSGGSLRDRLVNDPRLGQEVKSWLPGIASALDFCHENGCVHRDVKPDNILFDAAGKTYLSDFGIAKVISQAPKTRMTILTGAGMVLGTAQYMAPELVMGHPYDGRVDQYGLAVTVYEALAGKVPFSGNTPAAVFVDQSKNEAPPLDVAAPTVPKNAGAVVQRALGKDPKQRYRACALFAKELITALENGAFSESIQATTPPTTSTALQVTATCPNCNKSFRVQSAVLGRKGKCKFCETVFALEARKTGPRLVVSTTRRPFTSTQQPRRRKQLVLFGLVAFLLVGTGVGWHVLFPTADLNAEPRLTLHLKEGQLEIEAGKSDILHVSVARNGFQGIIIVKTEGLPLDGEKGLLILQNDEEQGTLRLQVPTNEQAGRVSGHIVASNGTNLVDRKPFGMKITRQEIVAAPVAVAKFVLESIPSVEVTSGELISVRIKVTRNGHTGDIILKAQGLPFNGGFGFIESLEDHGTLILHVPTNTPPAGYDIVVVAKTDSSIAQRSFKLNVTKPQSVIPDEPPISVVQHPKVHVYTISPSNGTLHLKPRFFGGEESVAFVIQLERGHGYYMSLVAPTPAQLLSPCLEFPELRSDEFKQEVPDTDPKSKLGQRRFIIKVRDTAQYRIVLRNVDSKPAGLITLNIEDYHTTHQLSMDRVNGQIAKLPIEAFLPGYRVKVPKLPPLKQIPPESVENPIYVSTFRGKVTCGKCDLGIDKACTTVLVVKQNSKDVLFYFDAASHKKYHGEVCTEAKLGTVAGTVSKGAGRNEMTVADLKIDGTGVGSIVADTAKKNSTFSDDKVKVAVQASKPIAGKQVITFQLEVSKGWHIFSNPVGNDDLAAAQTVVTVTGKTKPASVKINYPKGRITDDKVLGKYGVYEDKVAIEATIERAAGDTSPIEVGVRFQACNDRGNCLTPSIVRKTVP